MTTKRYVQPGACLFNFSNSTELVPSACVLESRSCQEMDIMATTFYSSRQITLTGIGTECLDLVRTIKVGRCKGLGDNNVCTSHASSCISKEEFDPYDKMCEVWDDVTPGSKVMNTRFGRCYDDGEIGPCAWDDSECNSNDGKAVWIGVSVDMGVGVCGCESVRVGACQDNGSLEYYCAVSPDACDSNSTFVKPSLLPGFECLLCRKDDGEVRPPKAPAPTTPPQTEAPFAAPVNPPVTPPPPVVTPPPPPVAPPTAVPVSTSTPAASDSTSNEMGLVVGSILGVFFGSLLLTGLFVVVWRRCNTQKQPFQSNGSNTELQ